MSAPSRNPVLGAVRSQCPLSPHADEGCAANQGLLWVGVVDRLRGWDAGIGWGVPMSDLATNRIRLEDVLVGVWYPATPGFHAARPAH